MWSLWISFAAGAAAGGAGCVGVGGMLAMMLKVDVEMGRFYSSRCAAEL